MVSYETIAVKLLSDADVNVSIVAQNFWEEKNYGLSVTVSSKLW